MKKYILNLIPFILGIGCFIAYKIIGSSVLPDGTLQEPFGLIPIGFLLFFIGIIGLVVKGILTYISNKKITK